MQIYKKYFLMIALLGTFFLCPLAARAQMIQQPYQGYKYAHNEAEYSVELLEPPSVETIWGDQKEKIPFLDNTPKFGAIGELARIRRVDPETEDIFDVKITFLKADRDYLLSMTADKIKVMLENELKKMSVSDMKFNVSSGTDTLKWGTMTGFSIDPNNRSLFSAVHFLTGQKTILVIHVKYSVESKLYQEYYKKLAKSIAYHAY
jgi:hypothetical protein